MKLNPGGLTLHYPAVYTLIRQDGKLLFVKRSNTGFMNGFYSLPAGRVEPAERYKAAAIREAWEESGVTVQPEDMRLVHTQERYIEDDNICVDLFFVAEKWSGTPVNNEPESHSEIAWFPENDLPYARIMDFQAHGLQAITRGETYGEFGWPEEAASKES